MCITERYCTPIDEIERVRISYLSMTWTTPLATRTSGMMTFAEFTKIDPSSTVIVTLPPLTVVNVVLLNKLL